MRTIAFYDTKPYDKIYFDKYKEEFNFKIRYIEYKLNAETAIFSKGCDAVCAFVNDDINKETIDALIDNNIKIIAMRCAGYNNVDIKYAYKKIHIARVPAYSPYAVAEHAIALLMTLNRKIHRAYNRTREHNFSLNALIGFDLFGKTIGVVGTGKIGKCFIDIARGFGMKILAYDPRPVDIPNVEYVDFDTICTQSDIISLHCPLTKETHHIINKEAIDKMKESAIIINTSRGALIDSEALLDGLKSLKIAGAALDVYEEESEVFYEDLSYTVIKDDVLSGLIAMPNVIVTSHQAFLTHEALNNIAHTTLSNAKDFFENNMLENEVCYLCEKKQHCQKEHKKLCF